MHYRELRLDSPGTDRTVEASLSSETPVLRPGLGREILSHAPGAVDLSRSPLPVLTSHNRDETPVGIVENLRIVAGKLRGTLRFGAGQRALDAWADVQAGVLRSISIGYQILAGEPKGDEYIVSKWQPFEVSLVSVPADPSVGIGRNFTGHINIMEQNTQLENQQSRGQHRASARSEEETRAAFIEISAIQEQFKVPPQQVRRYIEQHGPDLDGFRQFVMSSQRDTGALRPHEGAEIGLSHREIEQFSFTKAVMAQIDPTFGSRAAGLELEASRAVAKQLGREPQGVFVPPEVLRNGRRDLVVGTASAGGYLRPTDLFAAGFIDILRTQCQVINLGATQLNDLRGNLAIPSQVGAGTAYWVVENSAPTESQQAFGQVALDPKTVGGFSDFSRKMMLQASPDVEMLVRRDLAGIIAVEVDRVAIVGSGSGAEPRGVLNTSGIGAVAIGTDGGAPTWAHVLQLEEALAIANADMASVAYLSNAKVRRKLKQTTKVASDAGAGFVWEAMSGDDPGWGRMNGYRAVASNNCPSNLVKGSSGAVCSAIVLGDWRDLVIGQWGALDLLADPYTGGTSGTVRVIALLDCDIAVRRVGSFVAIKDATTT